MAADTEKTIAASTAQVWEDRRVLKGRVPQCDDWLSARAESTVPLAPEDGVGSSSSSSPATSRVFHDKFTACLWAQPPDGAGLWPGATQWAQKGGLRGGRGVQDRDYSTVLLTGTTVGAFKTYRV